MTKNRLTKEQILAIPEKLLTQTRIEIAQEWGINKETVARWARELKRRGYEIPDHRKGKSILD